MTTAETADAPYQLTRDAIASAEIDGRPPYCEERFDVQYHKTADKRVWRVTRGLAGTIGYVQRGRNWQPLDRDMRPTVTPNQGWSARWVAAHELAMRVPMPPREWEEQFRVS